MERKLDLAGEARGELLRGIPADNAARDNQSALGRHTVRIAFRLRPAAWLQSPLSTKVAMLSNVNSGGNLLVIRVHIGTSPYTSLWLYEGRVGSKRHDFPTWTPSR